MEHTKGGIVVVMSSLSAKGQMLLRLQSWSQDEVSIQPKSTAPSL